MPKTSNRLDRISDQIKQELACLIREELRDPRLGMVSVIDAKVSRDLAHSDIYVTVMGAETAPAVAALNNASGYLRTLLAKRLNLRSTPRLRFIFDESIERGRSLSALIDKAVALDASQHVDEDGEGSGEADMTDQRSDDKPAS